MATGLPSQTQVIELLDDEFARAGYDIEDVVIDARSQPPRITVIADGDAALDLDAVAQLSRSASDLLEPAVVGSYVLEVTSPGVERPLTTEKHFSRARGRKVELTFTDGAQLSGRIGTAADGAVDVVVRDGKDLTVRRIALTDVAEAVVQVEFSPPPQRELELAGVDREGG